MAVVEIEGLVKDYQSAPRAINEAEKTENTGRLKLLVWREGKEMDVELKLKELGSFSDTAPYRCKKTDAIVDMACNVLKDAKLNHGWNGCITALGMLSTGHQDLMPKLTQFAHDL